jgi:hypothetical protein
LTSVHLFGYTINEPGATMSTLLLDPVVHTLCCVALVGATGLAVWLLPWSAAEIEATERALLALGQSSRRTAQGWARQLAPAAPHQAPALHGAARAR